MSVRSFLFGSTIRIVVLLVVLLGVGGAVAFTAGVIGVPHVATVENSFGTVTDATTQVNTDIVVTNPNPVGVHFSDATVNYTVDMNEVRLASGEKDGLGLSPGNTTLPFETQVENDRIPAWWVSHLKHGEHTTVRVNANVRAGVVGRTISMPTVTRQVNTDIISQFNSTEHRPINANQPVVEDPVAYVNETSAHWGTVTEAETPIEMTFVVYNAKDVPLTVSKLGYNVTMNDVHMGKGETDRSYVIPPHGTRAITTTVTLENDHLDEWWVSHLERNQRTDLKIDFYARLDVAGTSVRVPLRGLTYRKTIETDIFGNKDETGNATGTTTTTAGSSGTTASSTTATATQTETATTESTTTATTATTTTTTATTTTTTTTTQDGGLLGT